MDGSGETSRPTLQQRLDDLVKVESKIQDILRCAQHCMSEMSKEKQIGKGKMEEAASNFRNNLNFIEQTLSSNMAYLSNVCVGTPHQGSTFASQQKMALAADCEYSLHTQLARIKDEHFPKEEETMKVDTLP